MKIEYEEQDSSNRIVGELKIFENNDLIGFLEYSIKEGILHVNNLKNKASDCYRGIGSALMGAALVLCLNKKIGFSFEVAKGSEEFYKAWIPRALTEDSRDLKIRNFFIRVHSGDSSKLTSRSLTYKFSQLEHCCQIDKSLDPCSYVKNKQNGVEQNGTPSQ